MITLTLTNEEYAALVTVLDQAGPIYEHAHDPQERADFARLVKQIRAEGKPPIKRCA